MEIKKMNWFGLAGGVISIALVALSAASAYPWWQLTLGQEFGQANISPLSYNVSLLGFQISTPLVWFLNLAAHLSLLACGIAMLIYSILPNKTYSKNLLNFAYKKPLFLVVLFVISLFAVTYIAGMLLHISVPLTGSANITFDLGNATIDIPIATGFTWVFWLAVVNAGLCFVARLYHRKVSLT